jgi:hypothetical protein
LWSLRQPRNTISHEAQRAHAQRASSPQKTIKAPKRGVVVSACCYDTKKFLKSALRGLGAERNFVFATGDQSFSSYRAQPDAICGAALQVRQTRKSMLPEQPSAQSWRCAGERSAERGNKRSH